MDKLNYTDKAPIMKLIAHLLNRKAPLPLDQQGNVDWGTAGQVLSTDGQGNAEWTDGGGSGGGDVTDVEVNGTSVVNAQGVAEVSVPTKTSDLTNDSDFVDGTDLSTALSSYTPTSGLSAVATSGDYDDLSNKPSIPTKTSDLTNDSDFVSDASYVHTDENFTSAEKTKLGGIAAGAEVNVQSDWNEADSSSDAYIANKPTIPTVNDGTLTIQQNGTTVGTFSANQSGNTTVNLTGGGSTYTAGDGIDITNDEISVDTAFTEASTRANIASGDSLSTILGKIKKFFSDLKTVAFTGSYNDLSNQPTIPTNTNQLTNGAGFITSSGSITGSSGSCTGNAATATKATQDADGKDIRMKYVNIYNSNDIVSSNSVTLNDLANQGTATGMIYPATDNPKGSAGWVHVWSQAWKKGVNTSWVSQLAMGVSDSNGIWYRTGSGSVVGRSWKRIIDQPQMQVKNTKTVLYAHTQDRENKDNTYTMTADGYVQILGQQRYYVWSGFEIYVNGVNMYAVFQQGNSTPSDIDKLFLYTVHVFKGDTVRFRVVDAHADLNFFG